jgi:membrane-associated PAP2 superfamily phosphatase
MSEPQLPLPPAGVLRRAAFALLASALLLVALSQYTNIDLALADRSFDATLRQFPWRKRWIADDFMHLWVKLPLVVLGSLLVLTAVCEGLFRWPRLAVTGRWRLRTSAALALLVPLVIGLLKHASASPCPWAVDRYGGHSIHLRLLDALPAGFQPGACLPAGHASSALWLAGLCVWWLPQRPRRAAAVFAGGLGAGFALGWVQQLRGAHFLSHTLWSMWIAAALVWGVLSGFALLQRARAEAGGTNPCMIQINRARAPSAQRRKGRRRFALH